MSCLYEFQKRSNVKDRFDRKNLDQNTDPKTSPYHTNKKSLSEYKKGDFTTPEIIVPNNVPASKLIFYIPSKEEEQKMRDYNAREKMVEKANNESNEAIERRIGPSLKAFNTLLSSQFEFTPNDSIPFKRASTLTAHVKDEIEFEKKQEEFDLQKKENARIKKEYEEGQQKAWKDILQRAKEFEKKKTAQDLKRDATYRNAWRFETALDKFKGQKQPKTNPLETNPHDKYPEID